MPNATLRYISAAICLLGPISTHVSAAPDPQGASTYDLAQGAKMMEALCMNCHRVGDRSQKKLLAPPFWGIRTHYAAEHPDEEAFVAAIVSFVREPAEDASLMPGAVDRFGRMAPMRLPEEMLQNIAAYIYAGELEKPAWAPDKPQPGKAQCASE